jgi:hypothetical protein
MFDDTPLIPSYSFGNTKCAKNQNFQLDGKKWVPCVKSKFGKKVKKVANDLHSLATKLKIKTKNLSDKKIANSIIRKYTIKLKNKQITASMNKYTDRMFKKYKIHTSKSKKTSTSISLMRKLISKIVSNKRSSFSKKSSLLKTKKVSDVKSKSKVRQPRKLNKAKRQQASRKSSFGKMMSFGSKGCASCDRGGNNNSFGKKMNSFGWWDNTQKEYLPNGSESSMDSTYPFYNNDGWVPYTSLSKNAYGTQRSRFSRFGNEVPYVPGAGPFPAALTRPYPFTML